MNDLQEKCDHAFTCGSQFAPGKFTVCGKCAYERDPWQYASGGYVRRGAELRPDEVPVILSPGYDVPRDKLLSQRQIATLEYNPGDNPRMSLFIVASGDRDYLKDDGGERRWRAFPPVSIADLQSRSIPNLGAMLDEGDHCLTLEPQPIADQWMGKCKCGWQHAASLYEYADREAAIAAINAEFGHHVGARP